MNVRSGGFLGKVRPLGPGAGEPATVVPKTVRVAESAAFVRQSEQALAEGRADDAIDCLRRAIDANPENIDAFNGLAYACHLAGDRAAAQRLLENALSLDRLHTESLSNLAALLKEQGNLARAESLFLAACETAPDRADLWHDLAQVRVARGNAQGALHALDRLAALTPDQPGLAEAREELGRVVVIYEAKPPAVDKQRILVINNLYPPQELGGYGRLMFDFANLLRERGHEVKVLTSNTEYLGAIDPAAEPHVDRSLRLFGGWKDAQVFRTSAEEQIAISVDNGALIERAITEFAPTCCFYGNGDLLGAPALQTLLDQGIPVLHYLANRVPHYPPQETPRHGHYRPVACSRWLSNDMQPNYGYQAGVLYPGALVDNYAMAVLPARNKLHIAYASIVMGYKGAHILVGALDRLNRMGVDFTCTIAGDSFDAGFVTMLKDAIRADGLDQKVTFTGYLPRAELRALFARSNVLAFPSVFQEPFGISQVEAMAAGLTVVTSGTGGASEIVDHERSGLVFKSEDADALANALASLPRDPARWERLAMTGQQKAFAQFDMRRMTAALETELAALMNATAARRAAAT